MEEKEEGLYKAMAASVEEGWSLLLHLLHRKQEVLLMASEFYCRASEVPKAGPGSRTRLCCLDQSLSSRNRSQADEVTCCQAAVTSDLCW